MWMRNPGKRCRMLALHPHSGFQVFLQRLTVQAGVLKPFLHNNGKIRYLRVQALLNTIYLLVEALDLSIKALDLLLKTVPHRLYVIQ
jgi:hypothetical protein